MHWFTVKTDQFPCDQGIRNKLEMASGKRNGWGETWERSEEEGGGRERETSLGSCVWPRVHVVVLRGHVSTQKDVRRRSRANKQQHQKTAGNVVWPGGRRSSMPWMLLGRGIYYSFFRRLAKCDVSVCKQDCWKSRANQLSWSCSWAGLPDIYRVQDLVIGSVIKKRTIRTICIKH